MSWLFLSCIPPLLFSLSNIIDEYLVRHHFAEQPMVFLIVACALEILPAALMFAFYGPAMDVSILSAVSLMGIAIMITLSIWPYLLAIRESGAGIAVPFFQLVPIFVFIMGWFFLSETLSLQKILAIFTIIGAACLMSWDFKTRKLPWKSVGLMMVCCLGIAIFTIVIRAEMQKMSWLTATTWVWTGNSLFSIVVLTLYKPWRDAFINVFRQASMRVSALFIGQAVLDNVAGVVYILALSLAPAAVLVQTMNGLQPFYIILLTFLMGLVLPQYFHKIDINRIFFFRMMCAVVLFCGLGLLLLEL